MIPVIPLAVAGVLAVVAFAMASKDEQAPQLPPGPMPGPTPEPANAGGATTPTPAGDPKPTGPTPAGAQPATAASAPAGALPAGTAINTGDKGVVHADDAFDHALADALARKDIPALEALAAQAEKLGLLSVARSIRDEIGRIKGAAPPPTPQLPDKQPLTNKLGTYVVQSGDTGEKIALKYVGSKGRWIELVTVNPTLGSSNPKAANYGLKIYAGQRINLPASWPTGVPVLPPTQTPSLPATAPALNTYTVVAGDTGEKVALKFVGSKGRWTELLTVNPTLKGPHGIELYAGHKINLPANWPATAGAAPAPMGSDPLSLPPPMPVAPPPVALPSAPESDARAAAREITAYLQSIGGLAGRYKEDKARVKAWQDRMGGTAVPSDGKYGRGSATAVMVNGLVPVAPYYWPTTNTQAAKANFLALVDNYAAADPQRAAQWAKLRADTVRS